MSLYNALAQWIRPDHLTNDMLMYLGRNDAGDRFQTWELLVSNNNLTRDPEAEQDMAGIVSYWDGLINSPDLTDTEEENRRTQCHRRCGQAYLAASRRQINESNFYEAVGYDPPGGASSRSQGRGGRI